MKSLHSVIKSRRINMEEKIVISSNELKPKVNYGEESLEIFDETYNSKAVEEETLRKCQELLNSARQESESILNQAKENAEQIEKIMLEELKQKKQELESSGYQNGFEKGYFECLEKYKEIIDESKNLLSDAEKYKVDTVNSMENEIIKLVLLSVEKIIRKQINENDDAIVNIIKGSIENMNFRDYIIIKVSREDFENMDMVKNRILAQYPGIKNIEVKVTEGFKKGDVEIESESGSVNPSISFQINQLAEEFDKLFSNEELI